MVMARFILWSVLAGLVTGFGMASAFGQDSPAFVPLLSSEEAWKFLPEAEVGKETPLPIWARALAKSLPHTVAAMLELDHRIRVQSPLDPMLRAKMRWIAAKANRSPYGLAQAEADLRSLKASPSVLASLQQGPEAWPKTERAPLLFAHKLTAAAYTITDQEVAELRKQFGDGPVVAMVLLLAHANFQDRIFLSLGVLPEANMASRDYRFSKAPAQEYSPLPRKAPPFQAPRLATKIVDADWVSKDYETLQASLEVQKSKAGRIPVPLWEDVAKKLPEEMQRKGPNRVKWSLVCMGYQPELALGWSACTRSYAKEANPDRVFDESLFWVVTRSLHCFY